MKRFALAAIFALILTSAAFAYDFGAFTMDVAPGWTASVNDPAGIVVKDDQTASITISIVPAEGNSAKTFADMFVAEFRSTFAQVTDPVAGADGSYSWEMSDDGVKANAVLGVENGKCKLVVMTGLETAGGEIANMLGTIKEK